MIRRRSRAGLRADPLRDRLRQFHLSGRTVLVACGFVLVASVFWIAITAMRARSEVNELRTSLSRMEQAIHDGRTDQARTAAAAVVRHARRAHQLTSGPAWYLAAQIPWLGDPFVTVRGSTEQVDRIGRDALPAVMRLADELNPKTLRSHGIIRLQPLVDAAPTITHALAVTREATRSIRDLPHHTWLPSVDAARSSLQDSLQQVNQTLDGANRAAQLLPVMLGHTRPQRYFVGLENEAEARGIGGLPGAFAIVTATDGVLEFTRYENDTTLDGTHTSLDLGSEFDRRYAGADPANTYANSDISPDFRDAGRIWAAMWQTYSGEHVDGALALDPTALSYLLGVSGPTHLPDGEPISAGNIVSLTQRDVYQRLPGLNARKQFFISVARAVSNHLLTSGDTAGMVRAATRASQERRLLVWSADEQIETQLEQTSLSGELDARGGPFAGFTVVNAAGSKLDYYLHRAMTYERSGCGLTRQAIATLRVTNAAPATPLPGYVTTRADNPQYPTRPGDNRLLVSYYATPGSTIESVTLDGKALIVTPLGEKGLVVVTIDVELPRGKTRVMSVRLAEPAVPGWAKILRQPLVTPMETEVHEDFCS